MLNDSTLSGECRFNDAETLFRRGPDIREKSLGAEYPCVTATLANLALVRREQHQYVGRVALPPGTHDRRPGSRTGTSGGVLRR